MSLLKYIKGTWHTVWAYYHLERVKDPVTFTASAGDCHHDERYKYHRRKLTVKTTIMDN